VDPDRFFNDTLPSVLVTLEGVTDEQRNSLLLSFGRPNDSTAFVSNLQAFLSDCEYCRVANGLPPHLVKQGN